METIGRQSSDRSGQVTVEGPLSAILVTLIRALDRIERVEFTVGP